MKKENTILILLALLGLGFILKKSKFVEDTNFDFYTLPGTDVYDIKGENQIAFLPNSKKLIALYYYNGNPSKIGKLDNAVKIKVKDDMGNVIDGVISYYGITIVNKK